MPTDTKSLATAYFTAWRAKDFDTMRSLLADDATFRGPLGTADNAEECLEGLRHMAESMTDIVVHTVVADGPDVITWFDLHMDGVEPLPTANWSHVEDGKITAIRATFDPRPLFAATES
jgi:ketosteroid isomerase-like protein